MKIKFLQTHVLDHVDRNPGDEVIVHRGPEIDELIEKGIAEVIDDAQAGEIEARDNAIKKRPKKTKK